MARRGMLRDQSSHAARPHAEAEDRLARFSGAARERRVILILDRSRDSLVSAGDCQTNRHPAFDGGSSRVVPRP